MKKTLSIVIPTYNMQNYLQRCLDSLLLSDKQMEQLEVLVVNDGSKDNSSAIAHEYETKYPDVFRVIDKENGNYGSCINRGLKEATGKYIKILDADDWFDNAEFSRYMEELQMLDVDMILTKHKIVDDEGNLIRDMYFDIEENRVFDFQEYQDPGVFFAMHAITYRTEMLRKINYRQTEGISYTDQEWVYFPQHAIKTCIYLPISVYRYMMGREGQTMDAKVMVRSVGAFDKLLRDMVEFANRLTDEDKALYTYQRLEAQIAHLSTIVYKSCLVLQEDACFDDAFIKSFDEFMRKERPAVYKRVGLLTLKKFFPIHYVRFWRMTGKRFPANKMRALYQKIRYGKK